MKYRLLFGWGIVIYAIIFLTASFFIAYGMMGNALAKILTDVAAAAVAWIAGRSLHLALWKDILPYSIGWVIIAIVLDAIVSVPFSGMQIYSDWSVLIGYAIILLVPLWTTPKPAQTMPPEAAKMIT